MLHHSSWSLYNFILMRTNFFSDKSNYNINIETKLETRPFFHLKLKKTSFISFYGLKQNRKKIEFLVEINKQHDSFNYLTLYQILRLLSITEYIYKKQ